MAMLLVGFDAAWTASNSGALVGALYEEDGSLRSLDLPQAADYAKAEALIRSWQCAHQPRSTVVMLDQPTIVMNSAGQRPVENIVGSMVSRCYGGMQPANTSKAEMFGPNAPIWQFLSNFGGAVNPYAPAGATHVYETYPVLTLIALGWTLEGPRPTGRLPKYNPERRKTFSMEDWRYVCGRTQALMASFKLDLAAWLEEVGEKKIPKKVDQDCLDACICLLTAIHLATDRDCLAIGNYETGYIVVPDSAQLRVALKSRCDLTTRDHLEWVRTIRKMRVPS